MAEEKFKPVKDATEKEKKDLGKINEMLDQGFCGGSGSKKK